MKTKKITHWEPENFELQMTTSWSFPERGSWATHNAKYRGNWSPYIPRNLLLRYSKEEDTILDQFAGGGTTLIEAKLLNRNIIGMDINPGSIELCKQAVNFNRDGFKMGKVFLKQYDARNLKIIKDNHIDFICTHPPYSNIINYSENIDGDLSLLKIKEFLLEMKKVANECYRVLKTDKFCAILMGDTRQNGHMIPMSFDVMRIFQNAGFRLKELIIKEQHNCKATGFWKTNSIKYNFLLMAHEYLFVFRKEKPKNIKHSIKQPSTTYKKTFIKNPILDVLDLSYNEKMVLSAIKDCESLSISNMAKNYSISKGKVAYAIASLMKKEIIKRMGTCKGGHWELNNL
jgi:DNA modification methylase